MACLCHGLAHRVRLLRALSNHTLSASRDGASTTSHSFKFIIGQGEQELGANQLGLVLFVLCGTQAVHAKGRAAGKQPL